MNESGVQSSFKAYDIRGRVPDEIDEEFSYCLGLALFSEFSPKKVVIGRDVRLSGAKLLQACAQALASHGVDIVDIGLCGTEEVYFAAGSEGFDLGIMITASHNPSEYNGFKLVKSGAVPLSSESGLFSLRDRMLNKKFKTYSGPVGSIKSASFRDRYINFLLKDVKNIQPIKVLMNPGNGSAGPVLKKIVERLPIEPVFINDEPDGTFPNGVPNPLLPERRNATAQAVITHDAAVGMAWDGDFDRCFFFDATGTFVESYYLIGVFAKNILESYPRAKILHDTRLYWNTQEMVRKAGGVTVMGKTGHAFMKERMRNEGAVYGGEMSAHHYFKDFYCCDSGMLPWLKLLEIMAKERKSLGHLLGEHITSYPCSGEINFKVDSPLELMQVIYDFYKKDIFEKNYIDGLDADCGEWRFNLRCSNTEPLLRLNVESWGDADLMQEKTIQIKEIIQKNGGAQANE